MAVESASHSDGDTAMPCVPVDESPRIPVSQVGPTLPRGVGGTIIAGLDYGKSRNPMLSNSFRVLSIAVVVNIRATQPFTE